MQRRPSAPSSARRRSLVAVGLGAVLALTGAPVAAGAADAPEAPVTALAAAEPVLPADAPRTGFETSGGAAWTTHEE